MPSDWISTPEPDAVTEGAVVSPVVTLSLPPPQALSTNARRQAKTNPGRSTADTPSLLSGRNEDCDGLGKTECIPRSGSGRGPLNLASRNLPPRGCVPLQLQTMSDRKRFHGGRLVPWGRQYRQARPFLRMDACRSRDASSCAA